MGGCHREQITNFSCLPHTKGAIGLEPSEANSVAAKKGSTRRISSAKFDHATGYQSYQWSLSVAAALMLL